MANPPFTEYMPDPPAPQPAPSLAPVQREQSTGQLFITVLLVALAFTAGWLGNGAINRDAPTPASAKPWDQDIWSAWNLIDTQYWNSKAIDHQKMTYAMISAMVESLGDTGHSVALTPAMAQTESNNLNNVAFVGIGIYVVQQTVGNITYNTVEATIPGSPANAPGYLLPGDRFLSINGTDVTNASPDIFDGLIRGKAKTTVSVTVIRPGVKMPITLTIPRASITPKLAYGTSLPEDHIGYIHLDLYATGASQDVADALKALQQQGVTAIILDLRDNGGGLVDEAIGVASDFLQPGQTVFNEKTRSGQIIPHKVDSNGAGSTVPKGLHLSLPMVILVNNNTASASEITTTGIVGNRPDVQVIGQATFGTDTILNQFALPSGAQLTLGVSQWLTPELTHLNPGQGLIPNKQVVLPANNLPQSPLIISELGLNEIAILACKGVNPDPQLVAAIIALAPARTSACTK